MRIGIVLPPATFLLDDRAFPYLGPLQIAAVARDAGHEVEVLDLTGHARSCDKKVHDAACGAATLADAERRVGELAARVDVVGCYSMAALHATVRRFLPTIRAANPRARAILGGPHATTAPERCAAEGWDAVVVSDQGGGGGEEGWLSSLSATESHTSLPLASNAVDRSGGGVRLLPPAPLPIVRIPSRADRRVAATRHARVAPSHGEYANDRWPYPARDLIDLADYRYTLEGRRYTSIVTQAGCPFACSFCAHWDGYRRLVLRSPEHVAGELEHLKRCYPWLGGVMFYDDEVNLRPDLDLFLSELEVASRRLDLRFRGFFKSGKKRLSLERLQAFKAAGFEHLCTGAEHADPGVLSLVGKGATVEDNTEFVRLCAVVGIKAKVFTQVGLPGESAESAEALARWLERMATDYGLSDFDVTITTPTAGTPLYEDPARFRDWIEFDRAELDADAEACNYKGVPGQYRSFVRTHGLHGRPGLERHEIVAWRQQVEDRGRRAAGLPPLVAKDDG